jgi:hypothetical protein
MDTPRMFALTRETGGPFDAVVGYGLVLPDGSAVAVSWPAGKGSSIYSTSSAEECATLRGADLQWIGEES